MPNRVFPGPGRHYSAAQPVGLGPHVATALGVPAGGGAASAQYAAGG